MSNGFEMGNMLMNKASDRNTDIQNLNKISKAKFKANDASLKSSEETDKEIHGSEDIFGVGKVAISLNDTRVASNTAGGVMKMVKNQISTLGGQSVSGLKKSARVVGDATLPSGLNRPVNSVSGSVDVDGKAIVQTQKSASLPERNIGVGGKDVETVVADEPKAVGGFFERATELATGGKAAVGTLSNTVLSKGVSNIGGAIDLTEDVGNLFKGKSFFTGTGTTSAQQSESKTDNELAVASLGLDVLSIALPFVAPIAATVQAVAAVKGGYEAISEDNSKISTNKSDGVKAQIKLPAAASASSSSLFATTATDAHSRIGGSSTF